MKKYRPGIFIITYRKEKDKILYLILKRKIHWTGWEFPKGGIEKNEDEEKAVYRELCEETGLATNKLISFKEKGKYEYKPKLEDRKEYHGQTWKLYACQVKGSKVRFDKTEHSGYKWLNFKQAEKILTWQNQKKCLKIVNKFLSN